MLRFWFTRPLHTPTPGSRSHGYGSFYGYGYSCHGWVPGFTPLVAVHTFGCRFVPLRLVLVIHVGCCCVAVACRYGYRSPVATRSSAVPCVCSPVTRLLRLYHTVPRITRLRSAVFAVTTPAVYTYRAGYRTGSHARAVTALYTGCHGYVRFYAVTCVLQLLVGSLRFTRAHTFCGLLYIHGSRLFTGLRLGYALPLPAPLPLVACPAIRFTFGSVVTAATAVTLRVTTRTLRGCHYCSLPTVLPWLRFTRFAGWLPVYAFTVPTPRCRLRSCACSSHTVLRLRLVTHAHIYGSVILQVHTLHTYTPAARFYGWITLCRFRSAVAVTGLRLPGWLGCGSGYLRLHHTVGLQFGWITALPGYAVAVHARLPAYHVAVTRLQLLHRVTTRTGLRLFCVHLVHAHVYRTLVRRLVTHTGSVTTRLPLHGYGSGCTALYAFLRLVLVTVLTVHLRIHRWFAVTHLPHLVGSGLGSRAVLVTLRGSRVWLLHTHLRFCGSAVIHAPHTHRLLRTTVHTHGYAGCCRPALPTLLFIPRLVLHTLRLHTRLLRYLRSRTRSYPVGLVCGLPTFAVYTAVTTHPCTFCLPLRTLPRFCGSGWLVLTHYTCLCWTAVTLGLRLHFTHWLHTCRTRVHAHTTVPRIACLHTFTPAAFACLPFGYRTATHTVAPAHIPLHLRLRLRVTATVVTQFLHAHRTTLVTWLPLRGYSRFSSTTFTVRCHALPHGYYGYWLLYTPLRTWFGSLPRFAVWLRFCPFTYGLVPAVATTALRFHVLVRYLHAVYLCYTVTTVVHDFTVYTYAIRVLPRFWLHRTVTLPRLVTVPFTHTRTFTLVCGWYLLRSLYTRLRLFTLPRLGCYHGSGSAFAWLVWFGCGLHVCGWLRYVCTVVTAAAPPYTHTVCYNHARFLHLPHHATCGLFWLCTRTVYLHTVTHCYARLRTPHTYRLHSPGYITLPRTLPHLCMPATHHAHIRFAVPHTTHVYVAALPRITWLPFAVTPRSGSPACRLYTRIAV